MSAFSCQSSNHPVRSHNNRAMEGAILFAQRSFISKTELAENWGNAQSSYSICANFVNKLGVIKQIIRVESNGLGLMAGRLFCLC